VWDGEGFRSDVCAWCVGVRGGARRRGGGAAGPRGARRHLEAVLHVGVGRAYALRGGRETPSPAGVSLPVPRFFKIHHENPKTVTNNSRCQYAIAMP
jgi:hypothetical protein